MRKIILSAAAILIASASVFATPKVPVKKAKAACTSCVKAKCISKATCPKVTSACVCK
jgi:hypothetical protein